MHPKHTKIKYIENTRFSFTDDSSSETLFWDDFLIGHNRPEASLETLWETVYDYDLIQREFGQDIFNQDGPGMFRFWPLLPVPATEKFVSLGEGSTPLVLAKNLPWQKEGQHFYLKNEGINPTGSFKDRYDCLTVNVAALLGYTRVACASTGNHALSVAAYSAALGLSSKVIVSSSIAKPVLGALRTYGADIEAVDPGERFALLESESKSGAFPVGLFLPGPTSNPFGVEGYKTIAYEICQQLSAAPDAVVFPCARGNGLYGAWKGFSELVKLGLLDRCPKMFACQPDSAPSLVRSVEAGLADPQKFVPGITIADAVNEAIGTTHALKAIFESGGSAVAVNDQQIFEAIIALGQEGIFAEPSSAVALAGTKKLVETSKLLSSESIVIMITSTGFKSQEPVLNRLAEK